MNSDRSPYVTYPWLITTTISTISIVVLIINFTISWIHRELDKKIDRAEYVGLCSDINELKASVQENFHTLNRIDKRQTLVLDKLKITPPPP